MKILFLSAIVLLVLVSCGQQGDNDAAAQTLQNIENQPSCCAALDELRENATNEAPNGRPSPESEEYARRQLHAMGLTDEDLGFWTADGTSLTFIWNQMRFMDFMQAIHMGQPLGDSGEVIAMQYFGGLYFNDGGVLVVQVTANYSAATAVALEEMRELGILVEQVEFTQIQLFDATNALFDIMEETHAAGATSWGLGMTNRVIAWLDPYTDEQRQIFTDFLRENGFDIDLFIFEPAITPAMIEQRAEAARINAQLENDYIVTVGDINIARTGIEFRAENLSDFTFQYGSPWDMAVYANGEWLPVEQLPGQGSAWTMELHMLQSGGIQQYRIEWEWRFGQLSPGRYVFFRDGWLDNWHEGQDRHDTTFEMQNFTLHFEITEASPLHLPPAPALAPSAPHISLVEFDSVTPTGMRVVLENVSPYDFDHRATIISMIAEPDVPSDNHWEWHGFSLPFLDINTWFDHNIQGQEFLPSGGQLEFELDWSLLYGPLRPGEYRIAFDVGGRAHPPHPSGWAFDEAIVIMFEIE